MSDRRLSALLNGVLGRIIARVIGSGHLTLSGTVTADRTWTYPDRSDTVAGLEAQTFTGNQRVNTNVSAFPSTYSSSPLSIQGADDTEWNVFMHGYYSLGTLAQGVNISFRTARGTAAAPAALQLGDHFGGFFAGAHNGTTWVNTGRFGYQTREAHTTITGATRFFLQTTDTGSITATSRLYVEPDGSTIIDPITSSSETKANGRLQVNNASNGAATYAARLVNSGTGANTAVRLSFDPANNGAGVRDGIIEAVNNGSNAISLRFLVANGAAPATALTIAPDGNLGIGVVPTAGNGLLQLASGTTRANGIAFGTDTFLFRQGAATLRMDGESNDARVQITRTSGALLTLFSGASSATFGTDNSFPFSITTNGSQRIRIGTAGELHFFGGTPVTRATYGAPTGTATRTTFDTTTVTLPQLAERVRALIDDLRARGDFA